MPLIYQHNINEHTKLGVWHIAETEDFFLKRVPLKKDVSHPHKRLQHLAGRYLLTALYDDFPLEEILIADTRKPFLENERYHFSISHCANYAAAIVSDSERVGVDVELVTPKIERVRHKFVRESELIFINEEYESFLEQFGMREKVNQEFLTMLWSCKEAIFKWYGLGQMDFKQHMQLTSDIVYSDNGFLEMLFLLTKGQFIQLKLYSLLIDNFVLSWLSTPALIKL
jgi:4'-phosphopantetheinyl transferase EntD